MAFGFGLAAIDNYSAFLKAYWRMEETGAANRIDDVGSNDAVPNNTPGTRAGISNLACDFISGSSQNLSAPHHADLTPTTGFAVSSWVYMDDTNQFRMIFSKGDSGFYLFRRNDNTLQISVEQTDTNVKQYTHADTLQGAWHHVVAIACDGFLRMFINGSQVGVPVAYDDTVKVYATAFQIGRYGGGTPFYMDGGIDEMAFWNDITFGGVQVDRENFVTGLWNGGTGRFYHELGAAFVPRIIMV